MLLKISISFVVLERFDQDWIWIELVVLHVFHIPKCDLFWVHINLPPPIEHQGIFDISNVSYDFRQTICHIYYVFK